MLSGSRSRRSTLPWLNCHIFSIAAAVVFFKRLRYIVWAVMNLVLKVRIHIILTIGARCPDIHNRNQDHHEEDVWDTIGKKPLVAPADATALREICNLAHQCQEERNNRKDQDP